MEFLVLLAFPMVACGCFPGHRSDLSSGLLALTLTTLPRQAEMELFNDMFSFMWHVASMLSFASEDIYDQYMQRYHLSTMKKIVPPECVTAGLPHPRTVDEVSKTPVPQLMLSALDLVQAWITASEDLPLPGLVPHRVFNYYSLLFLLEQGIQSYVKEETCDLPTYKRFYLNDDTVHLQVANSDLLYCLKTDMLRVLTYLRLSYCATTDMC